MTRHYHEFYIWLSIEDAGRDADDRLFAEWIVDDTRRVEIVAIGHMEHGIFTPLDAATQNYLIPDTECLRERIQQLYVGLPDRDWRAA